MSRCKSRFKSLEKRRAALMKELTKEQQVIAEGTSKKLDDAGLETAWKIFQNLTGYSEEEIFDKILKTQPKPLKWWQKVWGWCQVAWKWIFGLACFVAAVVKILDYFNIH